MVVRSLPAPPGGSCSAMYNTRTGARMKMRPWSGVQALLRLTGLAALAARSGVQALLRFRVQQLQPYCRTCLSWQLAAALVCVGSCPQPVRLPTESLCVQQDFTRPASNQGPGFAEVPSATKSPVPCQSRPGFSLPFTGCFSPCLYQDIFS